MSDEFRKELERKVADLEEQIHELEKDLIHDPLTGLKTKAFFEEEVSIYLNTVAFLESGKRREWFGFKTLSFVFFDVDNLKTTNDDHGYAIGDEILREISLLINRGVREGDTVARWEGNKIIVCLLGASEHDAREKAQTVRKSIEKITFTNNVVNVTISAGVSTNWKGATFEDMINNTNKALHNAKQTGKNKVTSFSEL